ncbi:glycosyltransferase family 2 protein [Paenibacillus lignilyticus]|uniref:Glycosyltransferase family 2 protein n=1 Tax=Paenibacillus lignilyticus TaxID=1172615 RepID=A0ABS5CD02_9BACL|nr:glycosyltransferase family 2 protein [Paenibacillus lignilyticus]MBP3963863.1 glycosyltransferase family 2 protein [Paenibacillus lignilyticus]
MVTISLCMIVRDEEYALERCLLSIHDLVDEINIIDTGSVDRTKEIARKFTENIYDFEWIDDFAAARNFAFQHATKDYILWLDADDTIEEEDRLRFKLLKQVLTAAIDRVTMPYNLGFDNAGKVTSSLRRNRLVRRACGFQWIGPVHEYLNAWGPALDSDVCVTHKKEKTYTDRNLKIYQKRQEAGEEFSIRDLYYYANELRDHRLDEQAVVYYDKMLNSGQGWIEDNIQACLKMSECYGRLANKDMQFSSLTRALLYERPRPDVSCAIGAYFFEEKHYETAIFWYRQATEVPQPATMGMVNNATSTWYPHLQLCLCYDRTGQFEAAHTHNEIALTYNPAHPSLLYNRNYFAEVHKLGHTS